MGIRCFGFPFLNINYSRSSSFHTLDNLYVVSIGSGLNLGPNGVLSLNVLGTT